MQSHIHCISAFFSMCISVYYFISWPTYRLFLTFQRQMYHLSSCEHNVTYQRCLKNQAWHIWRQKREYKLSLWQQYDKAFFLSCVPSVKIRNSWIPLGYLHIISTAACARNYSKWVSFFKLDALRTCLCCFCNLPCSDVI